MENKLYKFKKTGDLYKVLWSESEMKNPETRTWEECVIYKSFSTEKIYVREKSDFYKKFEPWEEK